MILKLNEKGINPLIATILMLLIALAISGLLYSWLAGFTTEKTTQATEASEEQFTCSKASFNIKSCDYFPNDGNIKFTLENKGIEDLNDWTIFAEFEDGTIDRIKSADQNLFAHGFLFQNKTGFSTGKVQKSVKFVPSNCPEVAKTTTACG